MRQLFTRERAMIRDGLLVAVLVSLPVSMQAQEGPGQDEYFGQDGKLYSIERSGSDVIKSYVLYRRPIRGQDGFYYDGKIRIVTEILGGGFTNEETEFLSICSHYDGETDVNIGSNNNKKRFKVGANLTKPTRSARSAYNLWWATCRGQFQKFK